MKPFPIVAVLTTRCGCKREMKWPEFADSIKIPLPREHAFKWDAEELDPSSIQFDVRVFQYKGQKDLPYVYYEEV